MMNFEIFEKKILNLIDMAEQILEWIKKTPELSDYELRNKFIKEQLEVKSKFLIQFFSQPKENLPVGIKILFRKEGKERWGVITEVEEEGATVRDEDGNKVFFRWNEIELSSEYQNSKFEEYLLREVRIKDFFTSEKEIIMKKMVKDDETNLEFLDGRLAEIHSTLERALRNEKRAFYRQLILRNFKKRIHVIRAGLFACYYESLAKFVDNKNGDFFMTSENFYYSPYLAYDEVVSHAADLSTLRKRLEFLKNTRWFMNHFRYYFISRAGWDNDELDEIIKRIEERINEIEANLITMPKNQEKTTEIIERIESFLSTIILGKQKELEEAVKELREKQKEELESIKTTSTRKQEELEEALRELVEKFEKPEMAIDEVSKRSGKAPWLGTLEQAKTLFELLIEENLIPGNIKDRLLDAVNKCFIVPGFEHEEEYEGKIYWYGTEEQITALMELLFRSEFMPKFNKWKFITNIFKTKDGEDFDNEQLGTVGGMVREKLFDKVSQELTDNPPEALRPIIEIIKKLQ